MIPHKEPAIEKEFPCHEPVMLLGYNTTGAMHWEHQYCKTSNISGTWVGNKIVDHSDVVGATSSTTSNYIFILDLTPGVNGLDKDNCKTRRETFKFWDLLWLILEILQCMVRGAALLAGYAKSWLNYIIQHVIWPANNNSHAFFKMYKSMEISHEFIYVSKWSLHVIHIRVIKSQIIW